MKKIIWILLTGVGFLSASAQKYKWQDTVSGGYDYKCVSHDPMQARFYTLKNGLTVILSVNHKEPRIAVRVAVRTGSNNDPKDHTGLAHYLEHLLFKGTSHYGSLDWEKEQPYLDKIDQLYETYSHTTDPSARTAIYHTIDSISGIASRYAIANEYDKLMANIGSQGTNAHTWVEETVYEEDIPSNAADKFLAVQAERFRDPVIRLFHTELEAVYEEKNRGLDNDAVKMSEAMHYYLFPTHNYGQQTTIGTIEHLKNPSILAIKAYYHKYYVPSNIAIIMSGDFNPDELIRKIDLTFSYMQPKPVAEYHASSEKPLAQPIVKDIFGPSAESMRICFRTPASGTRDAVVLDLISAVLANGKAGLLDLDLNKQQQVQGSGAGLQQYKDYGIFILNGTPKQGQSLEQVKDLLFTEIEKLTKGGFDETLIKAIIANSKLAELQGLESNANRAVNLTDAFIKDKGTKWKDIVAENDEQEKISKKEIMATAQKYLGNGYVLLYKRKGADKAIVKVDKPPITPVETNAGKQSDFVKKIEAMPVSPVEPQWMDFDKDISHSKIGNTEMLYMQNKENELFHLYYRFEMGSWYNKLLPLAATYLQFLSTDKYSAEDISKAFYNIACSYNIGVAGEVTTVTISGLQQNFEKAAALFEDILAGSKPDEAALVSLKERLAKARSNNKLNKAAIMQGLVYYARYGAKNPFNTGLTDEEIANLKASDLVGILHELFSYRHTVIYYGPKTPGEITASINRLHKLPAIFSDYPPKNNFAFVTQKSNEVLFADYDMVQSEIYWIRNGGPFDVSQKPVVDIFNSYFGGGMGSVVFQTIRESRALAYSTFASYSEPAKKEDPFLALAYVGCQADKMKDAVNGMNALLDTMPVSPNNFELAKSGLKKDIQTERVTGDGIIFSYLAAKQKGIDFDARKKEYQAIEQVSIKDIQQLHDSELSGKPYSYCIVGSDKKINMDDLKKIGEVKNLSLKEIFGY